MVNALTLWTWLNLHEMLSEHMNVNAVNMAIFTLCLWPWPNEHQFLHFVVEEIFENVAYEENKCENTSNENISLGKSFSIMSLIFALCFCGFIHIIPVKDASHWHKLCSVLHFFNAFNVNFFYAFYCIWALKFENFLCAVCTFFNMYWNMRTYFYYVNFGLNYSKLMSVMEFCLSFHAFDPLLKTKL